jgi:hypothetical protein
MVRTLESTSKNSSASIVCEYHAAASALLEFVWTELKRPIAGKTPSTTEKKTDSTGKIWWETENSESYMKFRCIIHEQKLCRNAFKFDVTSVLVPVMNLIRFHGHNLCHFRFLCLQMMLNMLTSCTAGNLGVWVMMFRSFEVSYRSAHE